MRKGTPAFHLILPLMVASLISAPIFLSSASWHQAAGASIGSAGEPDSITVTSADIDSNAPLSGFTVDVRDNGNPVQSGYTPVTFSGLQAGVQYQVVVYWFGNYYFREFSDGNLNRYALVTLNSTQDSVSLTGLYQNVPQSQAASLNILAQFPNGTQIGTTFNSTDYIQHTPGMWLTVTPPGASQPFTGSFTGGSILPFTLFRGQTYAVDMTAGYGNVHFSHWEDNNSPQLGRQVTLTGNQSYTAIYVQTASSTTTTTQTSSSSTTTTTTPSTSSSSTTSVSTTTTTPTATSTTTTTTSSSNTVTSTSSTFAAPEFPAGPLMVFGMALIATVLLSRRRRVS